MTSSASSPPTQAWTAPPAEAPVTPSEHNNAARVTHAALTIAAGALGAIPGLLEDFHDAPNSIEEKQLRLATDSTEQHLYGRSGEAGSIPWRDQVPWRPALPQGTRANLPEVIRARNVVGAQVAAASLGYTYFHGNRVYGGRYIATQSPLIRERIIDNSEFVFDTRADFWIAVRSHNVSAIVMLARFEEDHVTRYIPMTPGEVVSFYAYKLGFPPPRTSATQTNGNWLVNTTVRCVSLTPVVRRDIEVRELEVTLTVRETDPNGLVKVVKDDLVHRVTHYYYYGWPDGSTPTEPDAILALIARAQPILQSTPEAPVMVHCLAGHGRTGTLLLAICSLRSTVLNDERRLSVRFNQAFIDLRMQRYFLVQNTQQFIHAWMVYVMLLRDAQANFAAPLLLTVNHISEKIRAACRNVADPSSLHHCVRCLKGPQEITNMVRAVDLSDGTVCNFCSPKCTELFFRGK